MEHFILLPNFRRVQKRDDCRIWHWYPERNQSRLSFNERKLFSAYTDRSEIQIVSCVATFISTFHAKKKRGHLLEHPRHPFSKKLFTGSSPVWSLAVTGYWLWPSESTRR